MRCCKLMLGLFLAAIFFAIGICGESFGCDNGADVQKSDEEVTKMLQGLKAVSLGMKYDSVVLLYGNPDNEYSFSGKKIDSKKYKYVDYYIYRKSKNSSLEKGRSLGFKFNAHDELIAVTFDLTKSYTIGSNGVVWWNK